MLPRLPKIPSMKPAIDACVRAFYDLARADDLLGPVFNGSIRDWTAHIATMNDL